MATTKKKGAARAKESGRLKPDEMPLRDLLDTAECRLREEAKVEGEIRVHSVEPNAIVFRVQPPIPEGHPDPLGLGTYPWECKTAVYDDEQDGYTRVAPGWPVV